MIAQQDGSTVRDSNCCHSHPFLSQIVFTVDSILIHLKVKADYPLYVSKCSNQDPRGKFSMNYKITLFLSNNF